MKTFRKEPELQFDLPQPDAPHTPDVSIYHLNPPMLPPAILSEGMTAFCSKYNIAYWAWELDILPQEWQRALKYMNEIWVPSQFTANVIRKYTGKPVRVVPHPVDVTEVQLGARSSLGLDSDHFVVSSIFSFGSSFGRKNPIAVVRSFLSAFPSVPEARLVIKATEGEAYRANVDELEEVIGHDNRVLIVDEVWPMKKVYGLLAESDAYLSLHRAEGFGLTIAEAQLLGVPVVTTDWSGTRDFAFEDSSYLVPIQLTEVKDPHPEYRSLAGAKWAEPNVHAASRHLQTIYEDRNQAKEKAESAKKRTRDYLDESTYSRTLAYLSRDAHEGSVPNQNSIPLTA